jgi:hypothetical protein
LINKHRFFINDKGHNVKLVKIVGEKEDFLLHYFILADRIVGITTKYTTAPTFVIVVRLTMHLSQILALAGAGIGIVTIALGIVALATPTWIIITAPQALRATYSLFKRCNESLSPITASLAGCKTLNNFETPQGLTIGGVVVIGLGIIASILLGVLVNNRWVKFVPQVLLITGPTIILVGILYYVKYVLENFAAGTIQLDLGYSLILISITSIIGYVSSAYFGFVTGFAQGYHRGRLDV